MRSSLALTLPALAATALACGGAMSSTDDFDAVIEVPALVAKGDTFDVTITVNNRADKVQILDSLDIGDDWTQGVTITSSSPPFSDSMHVPIDNSLSYSYQEEIPAGGSLTVTLQATGVRQGTFRDDIDVCVGGMARFNSYPITTTVE